MNPKGGGWSREKWRRGAGPMGNAEREGAKAPVLDYSEPSRAWRDRGQTEKSWLLFEGTDTFLYGLMRKSKIEILTANQSKIENRP